MQLLLEAGADKEAKDVVSERDDYGHAHTHALLLISILRLHTPTCSCWLHSRTYFSTIFFFLLLPSLHTVFYCSAHLFATFFTVYVVFFSSLSHFGVCIHVLTFRTATPRS